MWLCCQAPFHLPASLLLSATSEVLGANFPSEMVLQRKGAPGLARTDIPTTHPQQDQVGHQCYRHRTLDPCGILGHLMLPHTHHPLPLLEKQFHRPASEVACRHSGRLGPYLAPGPRLVDAVGGAPALVASLDRWPTPSRTPTVVGLDHRRKCAQPISCPKLTNYR